MTAAVRRLPFGLARIAPPNLLGFAVINGFTFACDLGLLTALHGGLRWPVAVSITLSYAAASSLSYLLNRTFNFHSHAAIGRQVVTYIAVIAVNYLAWILGRRRRAGRAWRQLPARPGHRGPVRSGLHVRRHALAGVPRHQAGLRSRA